MYKLTNGRIPIIGCGGIASGADAIQFAKAGASVIQIYTSFGYQGPGIVYKIKEEAAEILERSGTTWAEIVGSDHEGLIKSPVKRIHE
jgi:dihydroorotate dehydrogenase